VLLPRPLQIYPYIELKLAKRDANWLSLKATNGSMTVPNAWDSQLQLPVLEYITGMIKAAVMVGEMNIQFWELGRTIRGSR
jgi:hypothetical protein